MIKLICSLVLVPIFLLSGQLNAQVEVSTQGGLNFLKLANGLNIVLNNQPKAAQTEIMFSVRLGSIYEQDSFSGVSNVLQHIFSRKIETHLSNLKNVLNNGNCKFESYSNTEQTIFKFTVSQSYLKNCSMLMIDSVFNNDFKHLELKVALGDVRQEISRPKTVREVMDSTVLRKLYRLEYYLVNSVGNLERFQNFIYPAVLKHKLKYYIPDNTICTISGSFPVESTLHRMEEMFYKVFRGEFNPEAITKIIDIKPMIYSSQLVFEDTVNQPEFQICWQFPGAYSNQAYGHKAYLLSSILNDKNNYIQVKAAKLGCKKLAFQYEANNFSSILRIIIHPDKAQLVSTYNMVLTEMMRIDKMLINETMLNAGKVIFKKEFEQIQQTQQYPEWVAKFWPYNDDDFFVSLADSIRNIKLTDMQKFTHEYVYEAAHVSALYINPEDRAALKVDSQFLDLNDDIMNYSFAYRTNVTDIESPEDMKKLDKLVQWLRLNTDIQAQVNGFADQAEFNKVTDDSVMAFIDSVPTFRKAMPDVIKKRSMRPELMRAMKIVKYLYDNGISPERLKGTSMVLSSSNKAEALANMLCTLTLEKLRDRVSLFEYHYGNKYEK